MSKRSEQDIRWNLRSFVPSEGMETSSKNNPKWEGATTATVGHDGLCASVETVQWEHYM